MTILTPKKPEEIIIKAASVYFGLEVEEYTEGKLTDHNASYQRYIGVFLLRTHTMLSFDAIAKMFSRTSFTIKQGYYQILDSENIKDIRIITDLQEIKSIMDMFTEQKKKQGI